MTSSMAVFASRGVVGVGRLKGQSELTHGEGAVLCAQHRRNPRVPPPPCAKSKWFIYETWQVTTCWAGRDAGAP